MPDRTKHFAIASYIPNVAYHDWHWPTSGEVLAADVKAGVKNSEPPGVDRLEVLPLRADARYQSLHFQRHAHWVIVEIPSELYEESGGFVLFKAGTVVFNARCEQAAAWLTAQGLPVPQSYSLSSVGDWRDIERADWAVVVGGHDSTVRAGEASIAISTSGGAHVGRGGLAVGHFAEVFAGDGGIAVTKYGRTANAGECGLARANEGTAKSGAHGISIVGEMGTPVAGDDGVAIGLGAATFALAGERGVAIGSNGATVGAGGVAMSFSVDSDCVFCGGPGALFVARVTDEPIVSYVTAVVGENGIRANVPYVLDSDARRFVLAPRAAHSGGSSKAD